MMNLIALFLFFFPHKFYVSVSYIEYDLERKAIEVQKKIFFDDFEEALIKEYKLSKFDIINSERTLVDKHIESYLSKNVFFEINGKRENITYLGHEYINGTINCYYEILKIKNPKTIIVHDSSLFSDFEDQENLIYFEVENELSTIRLKNPKEKEEIIIKN